MAGLTASATVGRRAATKAAPTARQRRRRRCSGLVVAWHGYRAGGHRIVFFALDAQGRPSGVARPWIEGWSAAKGVRPLGAPAGFFIDSLGRMLVVEDRNRTLLMLTRESK